MSLFGRIKQGLGIGTARVELQVPGQVVKDGGQVAGKVIVIARSDQKVKSVKVRMLEVYTTGRGDDKKTKEYELGAVEPGKPFEIRKDERRELDFALPFKLALSSNQALAEPKGALSMLGKTAVFACGEKSGYQIRATADLEGVALDPDDTKPIRLV